MTDFPSWYKMLIFSTLKGQTKGLPSYDLGMVCELSYEPSKLPLPRLTQQKEIETQCADWRLSINNETLVAVI